MKNPFFTIAPLALVLSFSQGVNAQTLSEESPVLTKETALPQSEAKSTETQRIASFSKHPKEPDLLLVDSPQNGRLLIVDGQGKKWHEQAVLKGNNDIQLCRLKNGSYVIKLKDEQGKIVRMTALNYVKID